MATKATKPIPDGYHSVTPYLMQSDCAGALEFYKKAFGAEELLRMPGAPGKVGHAEIRIGDSMVMMADDDAQAFGKSPGPGGSVTSSLMIYVADCDTVFKRALAAGASELRPLVDQFYGDRSGTLKDPFGHIWTVATHTEDVPPDEMEKRVAEWAKTQPK
jgi:PhnB protein